MLNITTKSLVLAVGGIAVAMGVGSGVAAADPTSTLSSNGIVRTQSAHYYQAPETVFPSNAGGCTYWAASTRSNNANALQRFHSGFARLVASCGGDGA